MANKYTPGPWEYRPDKYDDWGVVKSPAQEVGNYDPPLFLRGFIAQVRDPNVDDAEALNEHRCAGTDPWEANARLVAAAPELLDALECTLRCFDIKDGLSVRDEQAIKLAAAIIAKARGQ